MRSMTKKKIRMPRRQVSMRLDLYDALRRYQRENGYQSVTTAVNDILYNAMPDGYVESSYQSICERMERDGMPIPERAKKLKDIVVVKTKKQIEKEQEETPGGGYFSF